MSDPVISPERCAAIRARLHKAITRAMDYRQHAIGCGINQTDFCGCGLREAIEALDAEWKAEGAAFDQITHERDEAVNDARMGHARLDECSDGAETHGQPLYDRVSAKIQKLVELATEREHIIKAIGAEKEAVQAQADAARHRQLAAEYRAQRIVCDDELRRRAEKAEAALAVLTQERDELQERCRAISYVSHDQGDRLVVLTQREQQIKALIVRWRETAMSLFNAPPFGFDPTTGRALRKCAGDLEMALAGDGGTHQTTE